jgi:flagellar protein FliO/FliZ
MMTRLIGHLRAVRIKAFAAAVTLTVSPAHAAADPLGAGQLLKVSLGLLTVLTLMGVLAWLLRRSTRLRLPAGAGLETLGALSLGAQERVVLIRVGAKHLLLGVAPGQVQTLHVLDGLPEHSDSQARLPSQGFARNLAAALARSGSR